MNAGDFNFRWSAPCACEGASANPAEAPPLDAISALYTELGHAVAIGELADRLGVPGGAQLVEGVARFVASSPTVLRSVGGVETGGVASAFVEGLGGAALKAWGVVETAAARSWKALQAAPTSLLLVGAGVLLASQYLSADERAGLEVLATEAALKQDVILSLPPELRAKALAEASPLGGSRGISIWTWGAFGLAAVVALWAWGKVKL